MSEGLCPRVDVVWIAKDVIPDGVFERRQFPAGCLWAMAEDGDFCAEDVVKREGERTRVMERWPYKGKSEREERRRKKKQKTGEECGVTLARVIKV